MNVDTEKVKQMVVMLEEMGYSNEMSESVERIFDMVDRAAPKIATLLGLPEDGVKKTILASVVSSYVVHVAMRYGEDTGEEVWRRIIEGLQSVDIEQWMQAARLVEEALDEYGEE